MARLVAVRGRPGQSMSVMHIATGAYSMSAAKRSSHVPDEGMVTPRTVARPCIGCGGIGCGGICCGGGPAHAIGRTGPGGT